MKKKIFSTVLFILFLVSCVGVSFSYAISETYTVVNVDIEPGAISFKEKKGSRVTCTVTLPETCKGVAIDAKTVTLEDKIVADSVTTCKDITIIKFNRSDLLNFIKERGCKVPSMLNLSLRGSFTDGESFVGNDTLKLTPPPKVYTYTRPDKYSRGKLEIK